MFGSHLLTRVALGLISYVSIKYKKACERKRTFMNKRMLGRSCEQDKFKKKFFFKSTKGIICTYDYNSCLYSEDEVGVNIALGWSGVGRGEVGWSGVKWVEWGGWGEVK